MEMPTGPEGVPAEAIRRLCRQTVELDVLCILGRGESPEADALRDDMDRHWLTIGEPDRDRVRAFSAALAHPEDAS